MFSMVNFLSHLLRAHTSLHLFVVVFISAMTYHNSFPKNFRQICLAILSHIAYTDIATIFLDNWKGYIKSYTDKTSSSFLSECAMSLLSWVIFSTQVVLYNIFLDIEMQNLHYIPFGYNFTRNRLPNFYLSTKLKISILNRIIVQVRLTFFCQT